MSQTKTPLEVGMKLRIIQGDAPDPKDPTWHLGINWIDGKVPVGAVGTVGKTPPAPLTGYQQWTIDFPRALSGPNVSDQFEVVE